MLFRIFNRSSEQRVTGISREQYEVLTKICVPGSLNGTDDLRATMTLLLSLAMDILEMVR